MAKPYLAPSLVKLRSETNAKWPNRDKSTDGWLGDAAHAARKSEHNPNSHGAVTATDTDKDGIDVPLFLKTVIGDPRVWYVIHNRKIYSRTYNWVPRTYTGANPHLGHIHISLVQTRAAEEDTTPWFSSKPGPTPTPKPVPQPINKPGSRTLKQGSRGEDVKFLQRWLGIKPVDGIFGPKTLAAVKNRQKNKKLTADGIVGTKTWDMILQGK